MFKFNSNHIITGQIKQILNAFNLPSYKIYKAKHYKYYLESLKLKGTKDERPLESPELADGLYIKQNIIKEYKNGKWGKDLDTYGYNNKYLNITKNFPIVNNLYDSDTHEYLGEFLRFQRDYLGIDLMPLYNCFSNRVCNNLNISINASYQTVETTDEDEVITSPDIIDPLTKEVIIPGYKYTTKKKVVKEEQYKIKKAFYTKDKDFIIYMLPIKFFEKYTIAMDCAVGAEICCGLYDSYLEELDDDRAYVGGQNLLPQVEMSQYTSDMTYKKFSTLRFNNPILWEGITLETLDKIVEKCVANKPNTGSTLTEDEIYAGYKQRLLEREGLLKLFIKLPVSNNTSIVVLEGDYRDFNNFKYAPELTDFAYSYPVYGDDGQPVKDESGNTKVETIITKRIVWNRYQNKFITNYETLLYGEDPNDPEGVITTDLPDLEERPFSPISPLQLLMFNTKESYPFSTRLLEYLTGNVITAWDENTDNIRRAQKVMKLNNNNIAFEGAWDETMRRTFYDYMMNGKPSGDTFTFDINHDTLGYVDKDVEKFYTAWTLEYCLDEKGNRIPLTEKIKDENGNYIIDETTGKPKERQLYRLVNALLTEEQKKLLLEKREFILTAQDLGTIPMYKQAYVPQGTISNIDIYSEED